MRLKRIQGELGIQVCGGNLSGIFVESLDEDSPARGTDGLLPGDLILEVPEVIVIHPLFFLVVLLKASKNIYTQK